MEEEDIRIGKIEREVEKAIRHTLTSDVHLYVSETTLNRMARCHPKDYLRLLEKAKECVVQAEFARMDEGETRLEYAKTHFKNGTFGASIVAFVHEGKPKRWKLASLSVLQGDMAVEKGEAWPFRPIPRKARKSKNQPS